MVSQVALFLLTGHSSVSCMDTSYSPSSSCRRLDTLRTRRHSQSKCSKQQCRCCCCFRLRSVRFTCFYQRQSSEPQTWFLPPPPLPRPPPRSSASSCSLLPLRNLKQTEGRFFSFPTCGSSNLLRKVLLTPVVMTLSVCQAVDLRPRAAAP